MPILSQGPFVPGAASSVSFDGFPWSNPTNCGIDNGVSFTTCAVSGPGNATDRLQAGNAYGFNIVNSATIVGVVVTYKVKYSVNSGTPAPSGGPRLQQGSTQLGTAKNVSITTSLVQYTAGANNDTWGASLTPAIVNSNNFWLWFIFSPGGSGSGATFSLDAVTMTVYYTAPTAFFFIGGQDN